MTLAMSASFSESGASSTSVFLVAAGGTKSNSGRAAILSLAAAVGVGAVMGAATGHMPAGVLGGSIIGAWIAAVVDRRRERVSE
jgi:hypothetical protein